MGSGAERIAAERRRQQEVEGWTAEHDAEHDREELLKAASCYMTAASYITGWPRSRPAVVRVIERHGGDPATDADLLAHDANPAAAAFGPEGPREWPWDLSWWKPSADPIRNLEKAGALIAAEIDRLQAEGADRG